MSEAVDGVKIGKFYMGNPTADVLNDDDKKIGGCVHDDDVLQCGSTQQFNDVVGVTIHPARTLSSAFFTQLHLQLAGLTIINMGGDAKKTHLQRQTREPLSTIFIYYLKFTEKSCVVSFGGE